MKPVAVEDLLEESFIRVNMDEIFQHLMRHFGNNCDKTLSRRLSDKCGS